jgi:adenylate cyclase
MTFESDTTNRTYSSNSQTTKLLAEKIESGFTTRIEQVTLMFSILERNGNAQSKANIINQFFSESSEMIYAASYEGTVSDDDVFVSLKSDLFQPGILNRNNLDLKTIRNTNLSLNKEMAMALRGFPVVKNVSPYYNLPMLLILNPDIAPDNTVKAVHCVLLKMDQLLSAFEARGLTKIMMIDNNGNVVGHYQNALVLSETNIANSMEVKRILEQKSANGTFKYVDTEGEGQFAAYQRIQTGNLLIIAQVNEKFALEATNIVKIRSLLITVIVLILAVTGLYFFSKTMSVPLKVLVDASEEIKKGNFHQVLKARSHDEIGHLTNSFTQMSKGLEEREKLKGALNKFVNPEIAEQAMKGELKLGGDRKEATIFFSDIRSFTKISESMEPEEVVEFLNEYMTIMVKCINDSNGVVDKFIGDAIMAVWGVPSSKGNDEVNAINGCLQMRKELKKFNEGRGGPGKPIINHGIGLNSGPVLAGQIGSNDRLEYTVIGDAVNLASRVETLNKPFGTDLLISQETYGRVEKVFRVAPMQKIKVKGKSEPQQIYAVLGRFDDPDAPQTIEEMRKLCGIDFTPPEKEKNLDEGEVKYEILS